MCLYKPFLTHTRTYAPRHRLYSSCASHLLSGHPPNQCFLWALLQMDAQNKYILEKKNVFCQVGWMEWNFDGASPSYSIKRWGALLFPEQASAPYLAEGSKSLPNATYWCFAIVLRALRVEHWNAFTLLGSTCGISPSDDAFFLAIECRSIAIFPAAKWKAPKTILIAVMYPFFCLPLPWWVYSLTFHSFLSR